MKRVTAVASAVALCMAMATPETAVANSYPNSCDTGRTEANVQYQVRWRHNWDSQWWSNLNPRALQAGMDEYTPFIATFGKWSNASVMIGTILQNGTQLYAQIGWNQNWLWGGHKMFVAWTDAQGSQTGMEYASVGTDPTTFEVVWTNAPGSGSHTFTWYANYDYVDSRVLAWSPALSQAQSETWGTREQLAGDTVQHMRYRTVWDAVNGQWLHHGGSGSVTYPSSSPYFGWSVVSDQSYDTWDKYCPP
jgi:hypothetical protein